MRDKQIEEMAKALNGCTANCTDDCGCSEMEHAEVLYNAGYRKKSDVAREIFEEIRAESSYCVASQNGVEIYHTKLYNISAIKLDELKKKYESEGEG